MGGGMHCPADPRSAEDFFNEIAPGYINVGMDDTLLLFSGMDSAARLNYYSSSLESQIDVGKFPMYIEKISDVAKGFTPVPNAVGLGAFVIASILQMAFISVKGSSSGNSQPNPKEILEHVFADEKVRDMRDRMDEYLKSYRANLHHVAWLIDETIRQQRDLSHLITRLKNVILKDKRMSSRAVKHWVNAAAFHMEMLIHIARLKKHSRQPYENDKIRARTIIQIYHADMTTILEEYVKYKRSGFHLDVTKFGEDLYIDECHFEDAEIAYHEICYTYCKNTKDYYLDYIFSNNKQLEGIKHYFSDRKNNLEALVSQTGELKIPSVHT